MTGCARGLGLTRDPLGRAPYLGPVIFGPSEYVFGILFAVLGVSSKYGNMYLPTSGTRGFFGEGFT